MQSNSSQSDALSPSANSSNTPPTSDSATAVPPTIVPQGQGQGQGADSSDNPPAATDTNSQGTNVSEGETGATGGRKSSLAWLHFTKVKSPSGEVVKAQCTYCKKLLVAGSKNGTSHLNEHYKRYHKNVRDIRQQVLIKNISGQMSQKSVHNFSEEAARLALACMIVLHEYPLAIVDHFYFRKFLHIIQPLFKCPTRNTVKSDILKMYKSELEDLRNVLEDMDSRVAITSDMWTASHQKKGYMAITVHFIDNKWNMRHYIIRFCYVPCPHTAEALAAAIYKVLFEWNLDRKLSTVTLDNCSTNDLLVDKLKDKLNPDNLIRSGSLLHMRCCAHILNLIVKDGLDVVKSSVEIIRESVGFWTATPKRMEKFEEAARHLRIPTDKKLCLDCPTRWNSTYLMLNVSLIYKDVFYRLKSRDPRYKTAPTENDWWFAKEICGKLQVFYEVTELFSGSNYPTSNLFFAKICDVKVSLKTWAADSHPFVSQMAVKMIEKFDKYWSVIHNVLSVAAVLDPRYKMALLNFYFPLVYGTNSSSELFKVRKLLEDLVNDYKDKSAGKEDAMPIDNPSSEVTGGRMTEYDKFVDILLASSDSGKNELDTYLEDKVLRRSVDFDILNWWKANSTKYPTLSLIARDVLAIPISTVASESAFSAGGRLISAQRSRLHVKTVEALMCTQSWLLDQVEKEDLSELPSDTTATANDDEDPAFIDAMAGLVVGPDSMSEDDLE